MKRLIGPLVVALLLYITNAGSAEKTDREIKQEIIRESIARYPGNCPCPYNTDRAGRRCGGRSAYNRPGGRAPLCYESDVTQEMVDARTKIGRRNGRARGVHRRRNQSSERLGVPSETGTSWAGAFRSWLIVDWRTVAGRSSSVCPFLKAALSDVEVAVRAPLPTTDEAFGSQSQARGPCAR
jgi:choline dehydrogenase-like flavoprotein